ncbi:DUF3592 domain-containing protein [Altererythrobacter sp. ZODW24]|uniref:DUF3592 domain-containing protein n=1 Tax=Altererythrobacter sp. ZODW24 TaxID=2185142 RepID=UPI000DF78C0C|nr:DUF3592 domain-containing protein [Altererythrobacter sp. ZODW24]
MSKVFVWIGGIFLPVGLLFAGIGFLASSGTRELANTGLRTSGTVIAMSDSRDSDGGRSYAPLVEFYDANGKRHEFSSRVSSNPPRFSRGETVPVIYDPAKPNRAMIDGFMDRYLMPLIFGGIGGIFAIIGGGLLFAYWRRRKVVARLKQSGMAIDAKFVECYRDTSTKINGRSPYRVAAQATHPATGQLTSFKSAPIWLDLTNRLTGKDVRVLIDPMRPKDHFVDLSALVSPDEMA